MYEYYNNIANTTTLPPDALIVSLPIKRKNNTLPFRDPKAMFESLSLSSCFL